MPRIVMVTAPRAYAVLERYRQELGAAGCEVQAQLPLERFAEDELIPLVGHVDALICGDDRITDRVLAAAPKLKVIAKWGTGIDSIDREAAARRHIEVRNTPDAFSEPVADSVLGYVLLFARQLDRMTEDMKRGSWSHVSLRALSECTLGIVGLGNIGTAVARRAAAFHMQLLAHDVRPIRSSVAAALGVQLVTLEALLAESDFVTLHADLRPANRHMIDAQRLALMRPGAVLINTARGPLVDEAALTAALEAGRLAGAALDVFEVEPLPQSSRLREFPNVFLAPHNANASPAAADRVHANTIRNVLQVLTALPS